MYARHIHTLMSPQHTIVLHLSDDGRPIDSHHLHVEGTIIEEHMTALTHIRSEVRVREVDHVMGGIHLRSSEDLYHITFPELYRFGTTRRTHLWTLRVDQDADMTTHRTYIFDDLFDTLLIGMGRIHPDHIHTRLEKTADEAGVTTTVTDAGHNFSLLHLNNSLFFRCKVTKIPPKNH